MRVGHILLRSRFATICIHTAAMTVGMMSTSLLAGGAAGHDQAVVLTTVERIIEEAGQAKTDGNSALAYAMLHAAIHLAPENSLARWQLGQVRVGGEWLSIEEAQRRAEADPRQAKYRERKVALGESPQGQLELARWCRSNKLEDEARFHWVSVLSVEPRNKEAIRAVGMRWHDGELMTPVQIKESNKEAINTKKGIRQWAGQVAEWMRALSEKNESPPVAIVEAIRAVDDVGAIPSFEKVTLSSALTPTEKNPAPKRLSLAFLGALKDMSGIAGTNSLLRYAVMSPFDEVRAGAIEELRNRPLPDFVPTLLDNLVAPIQSTYRVINDPDGSVHYLRAVYQEGPFADRSYRTERSILQPGASLPLAANLLANARPVNVVDAGTNTRSGSVSEVAARQSSRNYEQEIMAGETQVAQTNAKNGALNSRIIAVLAGTTQQNLGSEPRPWWDWWQDYTDYYRGGERPVYAVQDSSSQYVRLPVQSGPVECFAQGTPVWTKTGQRAIESLQIGDLVLSQNVNTGEIRYKPVIARTLRPAGPIVQISTWDEKLLATRGHLFWVEGNGWRMAKELGDGAGLHTLAGDGQLRSVRPAKDAETYNLVVADFNTYFVGTSGILAHDNTPRRPTQAVLPGIVAKERSAALTKVK